MRHMEEEGDMKWTHGLRWRSSIVRRVACD